MEKAKKDLQQKTAAEAYLAKGFVEGQSVKPALTAATKKKEKSEKNLQSAEGIVKTLTANFKDKFKHEPAPVPPAPASAHATGPDAA